MIDIESYNKGYRDTMNIVADIISDVHKKVIIDDSLYVKGYLMAIKDISTGLLNMNTERDSECVSVL